MTSFTLGLTTSFTGDYKADNNKVVLISSNRDEILYITGMLSNLNAAIDALGYDKYISYKTTKGPVNYRITISSDHIYQIYMVGNSFTIALSLR